MRKWQTMRLNGMNDNAVSDTSTADMIGDDIHTDSTPSTTTAEKLSEKSFSQRVKISLLIILGICLLCFISGLVMLFNANSTISLVGEFLTYINAVLIAFLIFFTIIN